MAEYNFDGVSADGGDFSLIPEGDYFVIMEKAYEKRAKTGSMMIKIKMRVTEGPHKGKLIFENIVLCEAMAGRNKHLLKILKQPHEGKVRIDASDWENREFRVKIKHESKADFNKGKPQAKVAQFMYLEDESASQGDSTKPPAASAKDGKPGKPDKPSGDAASKKPGKPEDAFAPDSEDEEIPF